jgi:NAD-dependent SIR2 family protein deacetylase
LPDLLTRARRLDREEVAKVADFCDASKIDNIEDLLTAAQLSEFCTRNPAVLKLVEFLIFREEAPEEYPYARRRRSQVDVSSVALLQDTLQVLFGLLSSRMLPADPNAAHDAIITYLRGHPTSPLVTTNYDCCIDRALTKNELPFSYMIEFANMKGASGSGGEPTQLVKLHGSLNWFYCETCQEIQCIDIEKTVQDYREDRTAYPVVAICRTCGGQRRGLLVPPLAMKFDVAPPLNPLIDRAGACFGERDLIIVVGFSFADADLYISRMISKAMQEFEQTRLLIFDPDSTVAKRVMRKFSLRIPGFDPARVMSVRGNCAETLPKFLTGALRKPAPASEGSPSPSASPSL